MIIYTLILPSVCLSFSVIL